MSCISKCCHESTSCYHEVILGWCLIEAWVKSLNLNHSKRFCVFLWNLTLNLFSSVPSQLCCFWLLFGSDWPAGFWWQSGCKPPGLRVKELRSSHHLLSLSAESVCMPEWLWKVHSKGKNVWELCTLARNLGKMEKRPLNQDLILIPAGFFKVAWRFF